MKRVRALLVLLCLLAACSPSTPPVEGADASAASAPASTPTAVLVSPTPAPSFTPTQSAPPTAPPTARPTRTPVPTPGSLLIPISHSADYFRLEGTSVPLGKNISTSAQAFLYPGREQYEGDLLSLEIPVFGLSYSGEPGEAQVTIDDRPAFSAPWTIGLNPTYYSLSFFLPEFWDTTGQAGRHTVRVQAVLEGKVNLDITFEVEILPAALRPAQENDLTWQSKELPCCTLYYLPGTAAARDLDQISADISRNMTEVEAVFKTRFEPQAFTFYLIDNVWGNGAFAFEGGIVINYLDRNYSSGQVIDQAIRHEATHYAMLLLNTSPMISPAFGEGVPVYVAGGHYRPEPLRQRAAALLPLDHYVPLKRLFFDFRSLQHDARYLQSAAVVGYLVETYGWEQLMEFLTRPAPEDTSFPAWIDDSLQAVYGLTLDELDRALYAWLEAEDPGSQVEDLALTIELQNLRREYQNCCAPSLDFTAVNSNFMAVQDLAIFVREGRQARNLAIEAMLVEAQLALLHGDFTAARQMIESVTPAIQQDDFSTAPARDYLEIAALLLERGYEAQRITLNGDQATVLAAQLPPALETLRLEKTAQGWGLSAP